MLPTIHYLWVGAPTKLAPSTGIAGHDVAGPIQMAQKLQEQADKVNPIKFWCLDEYQAFYQRQFKDVGVKIEVCSIEKLLSKESQSDLSERAEFVKQLMVNSLAKESNTIQDRVKFKDGFSLFLLLSQSGYFFDTNVYPAKEKCINLPIHDEAKTAKSGFDNTNDFYIMYSPHRFNNQIKETFDNWIKFPRISNTLCFDSSISFITDTELGVKKTSYKSYCGKTPGLFFWLDLNDRQLLENNLSYGNINEQMTCAFSKKSLSPCSLVFLKEKITTVEKLLVLPFTTNDAYVATLKPDQIFYVNKEKKECILVDDEYTSLFDPFPRWSDNPIKLASSSDLDYLLHHLSKYSHPSYIVNTERGTLLHHAVLNNQKEQVKWLLEFGACADLKASYEIKPENKKLEFTPLELAAYLNNEEITNIISNHLEQTKENKLNGIPSQISEQLATHGLFKGTVISSGTIDISKKEHSALNNCIIL